MAVSRREVFIERVLKRLYAEPSPSSLARVSSREEEAVVGNRGSTSGEQSLANVHTSSADASTSTDRPCKSCHGSGDTVLPPRRMYTVSLPLEDHVAVTPDTTGISVPEPSDSGGDSTEDECQGQSKRKRIRRKKQKSSLQNSNDLHGEQTESGVQENVVQDNLRLQQIDSPKISKNKRRKMKKKRHKEKMRAAGLITKTTSVDFTYQPDKNIREEAAGLTDIDEKADSILDFLQATQQIYFADNKSAGADSAVNSATAQELLQSLESRTISASDVALLHQLKSLVLLQDVNRLGDALKQFQEQAMMPPAQPDAIQWASSTAERWNWLLLLITVQSVCNSIDQCVDCTAAMDYINHRLLLLTLKIFASLVNPSDTAQMTPSDFRPLGLKLIEDSEIMVVPLRRMTPGYIRLLQTQAAGKIVINSSDALLQRTALLLGMFGISISSYSTHQLTQNKRTPLIFQTALRSDPRSKCLCQQC